PPMLRVGDAMAMSPSMDAVLIVTRANLVRSSMLADLRRALDQSSAVPLGFAVTGSGSDDGYGYGYGYRSVDGPSGSLADSPHAEQPEEAVSSRWWPRPRHRRALA